MSSKGDFLKGYVLRQARFFAMSLACTLGSLCAWAVPATPRPVNFTASDGSVITVSIRGDERSHFYLSDDGIVISPSGSDFFYMRLDTGGALVPTDIPVTSKQLVGAEKKGLASFDNPAVKDALRRRAAAAPAKAPQRGPCLFEGTPFPSTGQQNVLVILVDFPNKGFSVADPHDYFYRMLNEQGFSDYGGTGSARDYFLDNSSRKFNPIFDVYGPVTLPHNYGYYGSNNWWGDDENPHEMIIDACQLLDEQIDYTLYDRNGDGYIDNVYVFYAGKGEASGGSADTVWPHSWNIQEGTGQTYRYDGMILDRYACSNEWESGKPDGIGTFVHEFSHVLGLPDLYATDYSDAFTPGGYSALDYGPYNNDSRTPPCYGVFERYALDWLQPTVIDGPNTVRLQPVSNNKGCIIPTGSDDEFFLLENRQQQGWDEYIPGHGMLIWHIDYVSSVWNSNSVNNTSSHQYVDIEEADNKRTESSRAGDPFPGSSGATSFTDDTRPSMKTWAGKKLELPITDIAEADGIITFNVAGGLPEVSPVVLSDAVAVTPVSFDIEWTADPNANTYLVCVYTKSMNGDKVSFSYAEGWNLADVGNITSVTVGGLTPATEYFCVVYSSNGVYRSETSNEIRVATAAPSFDMLAPVALEATAVSGEGFTANWEPLDDAVEYFLTVGKYDYSGYDTDLCDFAGGLKSLPSGWNTNSTLTYANSAYSGAATPSLRLSQPDSYVASPRYDSDIVGLSFWHRGAKAPEANRIRVYALVGGTYTLVEERAIVNDAGGAVFDITGFPEGARAVKIEYRMNESGGSVAIDDIEVRWNLKLDFTPMAGYEMASAGSALFYDVEGLMPDTEYLYTVVATDGNLFSKTSNRIAVTTIRTTGAGTPASDPAVGVSGRSIYVDTTAGSAVTVHDISGRTVASARASACGRACIPMSVPGIYIVLASGTAHRIIVR